MKHKKKILLLILLLLTILGTIVLINQSNSENNKTDLDLSNEEYSSDEQDQDNSDTQTNNEGGTTIETDISLSSQGEVISSYEISNLMPGDTEYKNFTLRLSHENHVKISYTFLPDEDSSIELLQNLQIEVYMPQLDTIVYEGNLIDLQSSDMYIYIKQSDTNKSIIYYEITISLPKQTGNDCMNKEVSGKFIWSSEIVNEIPDDALEVPDTGDMNNMICIITIIILCSFLFMILLSKKKRGSNHE